ncbi:MAG TPA: hypothetical protein VFW66_00125 [Gemmatimonadales bacterium]|nr:hypothetical protein [Gemmatimonadales bacterium]
MKRIGLVCLGLVLGLASTAHAQLTMQMTNGWNFTFSGNVNAFFIYQQTKAAGGGPTVAKDLGVGTGLLPAFAVFDAKGKEGNVDVGVHFGFAPQVEFGGHNASFFGTDAAGAQIDMREVYLTAGGSWGQLLMGKELALYQRGNILTDMTLFGVGVGGAGRGTALGRIGYGYLYPDFRPQLTYSSPAGRPGQISIGLFDPIRVGPYTTAELPRVEAEANWGSKTGENSNVKIFVNGAVQSMKNAPSGGTSLASYGGGAGIVFDVSGFAITGSGFWSKGMGFLLQGDGIVGGANFDNQGVSPIPDGSGKQQGRASFGYIGQLTYSPPNTKWIIGGSFGENRLRQNDQDKAASGNDNEILKERLIDGQITYKWTKSLRWVAEYGHIDTYAGGVKTTKGNQGSLGMMLFF